MTPDLQMLQRVPLLHNLQSDQLAALQDRLRVLNLQPKHDFLHSGQLNENIYFLLDGTVRVYIQRREAHPVVLAILGKGEMLGDISALDGLPASASICTLEPCHLLWMHRNDLYHFLRAIPEMAINLVLMQNRRTRRLTAYSESLAILKVEARLARQLLHFAEDYGVKANGCKANGASLAGESAITISLRLTQGDLAGICGSSLKQMNRIMAEYQTERILSIGDGHRVTILSHERLLQRYKNAVS